MVNCPFFWEENIWSLGKDHSTTHGAVDAVYHTEEYRAGLMVANLDHRLYLVFDSLSAIGVALHKVASVLVHHKQMVILVEYIVDCLLHSNAL